MAVMVILLTHEYAPFKGGVAVYCQEVLEAARRQHLPFCVWAPQSAEGEGVLRLSCGGTLSPWDIGRMALELVRRSSELKNNHLVLASYGAHLAAIFAILVGGLKGCHVSSLLHGSEIPRLTRNVFWQKFAMILFRRVETVFCNSQHTRSLFEKSTLYGMASFRLVIAPCASSTPAAREATSRIFEKSAGDDFEILTLARIHPRKGQMDVATALGFLPEEIKRRVVYILGGKGAPRYLEAVIQRCVQGGVRFEYLGKVSNKELAATYASCDLFVMTSRTLKDSVEGFGISFVEAGWQGKPSIAYKSGGIQEAVLDGKTGLLVEEGDLEGLASAIRRLMENPSELSKLGEAAREYARSLHWETAATAIDAACHSKS